MRSIAKRLCLALVLAFGASMVSAAVTIKYWCATNPEEIALATELVAEWNASHVDMQVALSPIPAGQSDRKSTRLNSSHVEISYAVFCLKKKIVKLKLSAFATPTTLAVTA